MTRFRHAVVLEPVTRGWFDDNVGLGHDIVTEFLGSEGLPLAEGEHLAPGARYAAEELRVTVDSWRRRAETAGQVDFTDEHVAAILSVRLISASAPRLAELTGDVRLRLPRTMRWAGRFRGSVRADLERWWHAVGTVRSGDQPAIEGSVRQAMGRASFAIVPAVAPDGRWRVAVHGKLGGRGLLAPFTALALLFLRGRARQVFQETLDEFAEEWNREVPRLLATSPEEMRVRLMSELARAQP